MRNLVQFVSGMVAFCLLSPLYGFGEEIEGVRKKAEAGHAGAQLDLGWMYQNGDDVLQDDSEAVKWYRKAAEQGLASAQCNLGMMFMEGRGVARDKEEALHWFRKAARKGHSKDRRTIAGDRHGLVAHLRRGRQQNFERRAAPGVRRSSRARHPECTPVLSGGDGDHRTYLSRSRDTEEI